MPVGYANAPQDEQDPYGVQIPAPYAPPDGPVSPYANAPTSAYGVQIPAPSPYGVQIPAPYATPIGRSLA